MLCIGLRSVLNTYVKLPSPFKTMGDQPVQEDSHARICCAEQDCSAMVGSPQGACGVEQKSPAPVLRVVFEDAAEKACAYYVLRT